MGWLVRRVLGPALGYRKRSERHLAYIYPDMPTTQRRQIAERALDNLGRTLIENYSLPDLRQRLASTQPSGAGLDAWRAARDQGRAVIFVTGHFGNHDACRIALNAQGAQIGALYRPMTNAFFNAHYVRSLEEVGGTMFPQGRNGTMKFMRHLKSGGSATLLFDLNVWGAPKLPFLGKPAQTATSAAEMALRTDALVIPYFATRRANGLDFDLEIEAPIAPASPEEMTREMNRRLEARIAAHPEQWFWVHRRWKPDV